jgi:hypothetical protein
MEEAKSPKTITLHSPTHKFALLCQLKSQISTHNLHQNFHPTDHKVQSKGHAEQKQSQVKDGVKNVMMVSQATTDTMAQESKEDTEKQSQKLMDIVLEDFKTNVKVL